MIRPVSKPADMYNYQVAAYLKSFSLEMYVPGPPLKDLDFTVVPRSIPKENTLLKVEILFDIVISGSEYEYLCECKSSQQPSPLNLHSNEVRDSLLEFIAAEKYRIGHIKRDGIFYLMITNCSIAKLSKEIQTLRTASDEEILRYSKALKKRAPKKWPSFGRSINIQVEWIRNVLARTVLIEIDQGRLAEASKDPKYEQELRKIMDRVSRIDPALIPLQYRIRNTVRFTLGDTEEDFLTLSRNGYLVEISKTILDQIISCKRILNEDFVKSTLDELPFMRSCEITHHPNIGLEDATEIVNEVLNNQIEQHYGKIPFLVIINPGTYDTFYANLEWIYNIVVASTDPRGFYVIAEILRRLPIYVSRFVLAGLVKETMRLYAGIIAREDVMDFSEVQECEYCSQ